MTPRFFPLWTFLCAWTLYVGRKSLAGLSAVFIKVLRACAHSEEIPGSTLPVCLLWSFPQFIPVALNDAKTGQPTCLYCGPIVLYSGSLPNGFYLDFSWLLNLHHQSNMLLCKLQEFVGLPSFLRTASEGWDEGHAMNHVTYSPGIFSIFFFPLTTTILQYLWYTVAPFLFLVNFIYS